MVVVRFFPFWRRRQPKAPVPAAAPAAAPLDTTPAAEPRARFGHLRTARGNLLVPGHGRITMEEAPAPGAALIAILPHAHARLCFLAAPDLRPVFLQADGLTAAAISAFLMPAGGPDRFRLRHPLAPSRHAAVTAPGQGAPGGCVIFDSVGRTDAQIFTFEPLDPATLAAAFRAAAAALCATLEDRFSAASFQRALQAGEVRPDVAEALLRVLPRRELAFLAEDYLHDPALRRSLTETQPENPWFARVLPALAEWNTSRASTPILHSPASDEFAGDPLEGHGQPQAGFALNALARRAIRPRRGACLIAAARNEGPYVLEWLAHHRAIGFAHAFLYTNQNGDGSDPLLEALARGGAITLIHNEPGTHCGPQYKAYAHALSLLPDVLDYDWAAVLDLDEYIGFDAARFASFTDYLSWQDTQPVDAIALCWQIFAGARGDVWTGAPTTERFLRRERDANAHVKSVFRPHKFWHAQAHFPQAALGLPFTFRTETGALHHHPGEQARIPAFSPSPSAELAWVNHYLLRSAPEALWKLARGHGDWKGQVAERHHDMARFICRTFVALADKTDLVEDRRILRCAPRLMAAELASLRALPGVAQAEAEVMEIFHSGLAALVGSFTASAPAEAEPPEFAAFRTVLRNLTVPNAGHPERCAAQN